MLRVFVLLVAFTAVASADKISEGREAAEGAEARYQEAVSGRNPLARLWDLTGNPEWTNLGYSHKNLLEAKKDFEDAIKSDSDYQVTEKGQLLKRAVKDVDRKIAEYQSASKSMVLKLGGGLVLVVIVLFGGTIWALMRRRRR